MNLIPILQKHFKEGNKLYSVIHGWVTFIEMCSDAIYPIKAKDCTDMECYFTKGGRYFGDRGECILFPNTDKDWSKFMEVEDGDAVVYFKDEVWHLGRAAKDIDTGKLGVKHPNGRMSFPKEMIKAELFDFDNLKI